MKNRYIFWGRLLLALGFISGLVLPAQGVVYAAANLTIEPITWNVVGLDSNNVNVGPNNFPVGARVCNTGDQPAANVSSNFVWDSANANIDLRPGSKQSYSGYTLSPGACRDFYYEVQVTRTAAAYNTARRYHISATATGLGTVSTPTPREIFVERLVSQSRNSIWNILLNDTPVAAGGTMTLMVGGTYDIQLVGNTSTNGYEQIESYINFPNTIFQINSVTTIYTASSGTDGKAGTKLYANGCGWVNDPSSPNYRSCTGTGKYGGTVNVTYNVTIIGGGGTSQLLNTLVYDFSGSSYHYNGDFSAAARIAVIVDPATSVTFAKSFSPAIVAAGGTATLTFTITNPSTVPLSGVSFTDTLPSTPGGMRVASNPNASTSGCGSPVFAPAANDTTLSFTGGSLAASGTCTIHVDVTVPAAPTSGSYTNNSNHLFVGGVDTNKTASANLTLASTGTSVCAPATLAQWTFTLPNGASPNPAPSTQAGNVATANASATATNPTITGGAWLGGGFNSATVTDASRNFLFAVDTSQYSGVSISLRYSRSTGAWSSPTLYIYSSTTGAAGSYSPIFTSSTLTASPQLTGNQNAAATGTGLTYFRVNATGANNANQTITLDDVTITGTGCTPVQPPILSKYFTPDPIAVGGTSFLRFPLTNPNPSTALTGVQFSDTLPAGLTVAGGSFTACGGTLTTTAPNQIALSGATLAGGATCTIPVTVTATTPGLHTNVSGFVSSTEGGTNSTDSGLGTDTLTALLPPAISKLFGPNPILTGGTSTLTFTITNPNTDDVLTGVAFTDNFPAGLTRSAIPVAAQCGGTVTSTTGSVTLVGGLIPVGGTCTVSVVVTATASGSTAQYTNTSGNVSAAIVGNGNTASDTLTVNPVRPSLSLLKLVGPTAAGPWSPFITVTPGANVYYQFVIENTGDADLTSITLTDPTLNTSGCLWPATLPAASPSTDPFAVCVVGPVAVAAGDHPNTATAHGNSGGTTYDSNPSSADVLAVTPGFSLLKQVSTSASGPWASLISGVAPGTNIYYRFNVVNTGATVLTGISITDANVSTAACTFTDPLPVGAATTCIVGPITGSASAGTFTNTATAHATSLGNPIDSTPSSASYIVSTTAPDLSLTKTNTTGGNGFVTAPFTWTVQVSNAAGAGDAGFASGQTILSDPLPVGAAYGTVTVGGFTNITNSANINCAIAAGTLSCTASGGTVTIGAGGSFTASFSATPTSAGTLSNTATVDPLGVVAESDETNNSGGNVVTVTIGTPALTVAKTPDVASVNAAGNVITYTVLVTNSGNIPLTGMSVSDPLLPNLDCDPVTPGPQTTGLSLAVSANLTCTGTYTVTQADLDNNGGGDGDIDNTVTADSDQTTPQTASAAVTINRSPSFTLAKSADAASVDAVGDIINYTITLTNSGNVTLTNVTVSDPRLPSLTCAPTQPGSVAPAGTMVCTGAYTVTQSDLNTGGTLTNTATADSDQTTPSTATSSVTVTQAPSFTLAKTADVSTVDAVGNIINYTITLTNTGNVILTGVTISDPRLPVLTCVPNQPGSVNPGGTMVCTGAYTVTQSDLNTGGTLTNTATADSDQTTPSTATSSVTVVQTPALTLTKTANTNVVSFPGQGIVYTITLQNTGTVALTGMSVSDPRLPNLDCDPGTPNFQTTGLTVAPGASLTCTGTYAVSINDFINNGGGDGDIDNTVTVTSAQLPSQTASRAVPLITSASITLLKIGTLHMDVVLPADRADPGDTIAYAFTVTNTSFLPLTNITLADTIGGVSISGGPISSLLPGASDGTTFTGTYSLTQADIEAGTFTNTATVSGDGIFSQATDTDEEIVDIPQSPSFTVAKSPDPTSVSTAPSLVTYTITLVNTGNVNLTGVSVSDTLLADLDCDAASGSQTSGLTMAPGASLTCTGTYTVTQADLDNNGGGDGDIDNTVTVDTDQAGAQTASAAVTLTQSPALSVAKSITSGSPYDSVGDVIQYSYLVTNTGNVTLPGPVTLSDDLSIDETCPTVSSLAPGDSVTCIASYTVTQADLDDGEVINTATASAGTTISVPDTATATATQSPAIRITKTIPTVIFDSPQLIHITYSMLVENIGNLELNAIQVEDDLTLTFATAGSFTVEQLASTTFAVNAAYDGTTDTALLDGTDSLAPGASGTITLRILLDTGGNPASFTNLATASGWTRTETRVQDDDQISGPSFVDPAVTKTVDPVQAAVGQTVTYTITVTNNGSLPAPNVIVTDILPNFLDLALNPVTLNPNVGTVTITPPRTVTVDLGTVAAGGTHIITIRAIVNAAGNPVVNTVQLTTTAQDGWSGNLLVNDRAVSSLVTTDAPPPGGGGGGGRGLTDRNLPKTGFAPGIVSRLAPQPSEEAYAALGDVWIEIPALNVKTPIVGVPSADNGWNTTWLTNETGWLEGSAFPGWEGNSALTGHVYLSNGKPGPFVNLSKLKWGDRVIVHAYGEKYTFEVRENKRISPSDGSVLKHEEYSWLTLLTCNSFNPVTEEYALRVSVRAVLVKAEAE